MFFILKLFIVAGIKEKIVIADYDISESLLRRDFGGIDFEHIKSVYGGEIMGDKVKKASHGAKGGVAKL